MGRNNVQDRSHDYNWGYDLTQKKPFKFELLNEQQCRNFELAQGLQMFKLTMAIKINGYHSIKNDDDLNIKGTKYKVVTMSDSYDNQGQGRYKASLKDFTGNTYIGLE